MKAKLVIITARKRSWHLPLRPLMMPRPMRAPLHGELDDQDRRSSRQALISTHKTDLGVEIVDRGRR